MLLTGCGLPAPGDTRPVAWQVVTVDGAVRQLEERPAEGKPGIDEAAARARAVEHVPGSADAAAVQARFVALTMAADQEVWNFQARPVWLVTYQGVPFTAENCACQGKQETANTVVAIDGRDGAFVMVYGVGAGG